MRPHGFLEKQSEKRGDEGESIIIGELSEGDVAKFFSVSEAIADKTRDRVHDDVTYPALLFSSSGPSLVMAGPPARLSPHTNRVTSCWVLTQG